MSFHSSINRPRPLSTLDIPGYDDSEDEFAVDASIPSTPIDDHEDPLPSSSTYTKAGSAEGHSDHASKADGDHVSEDGIDDRQCRICFSGVEEEESQGRLISPCLCTGSMRYVHVNCINAWRGTGSNAKAFMECPQCHHQYHLRRTLVSGLATSQPLLLITSTILFTILTLLSGSILHYLLQNSSSTRRRLLTTATIFDTAASDSTTWDSSDGTIIIVGSGGAIVYDIFIAAIQTFTSLAVDFADKVSGISNDIPGPIPAITFHLGIRFILGLAVLGSLSFLSLLLSMSLFGPLHLFNTFRGVGMFRNWGRRRDGNTNRSIGQFMIVVFVLIGTINTIWGVYVGLQGVTRRMLRYVEAQILEVNPDTRRKEAERRKKRKEEWWGVRWIREGRWKTRIGWKEVGWRLWWMMKDMGKKLVKRLKESLLREGQEAIGFD